MQYIALLRGINVGGKKKVDMKTLKQLFEDLRFENVQTYINSGNVIFSLPKTHPLLEGGRKSKDTIGRFLNPTTKSTNTPLKELIESSLEKTFGFFVPILLRTREEFLRTCAAIPVNWTNDTTMKTDIIFLWDDINTPEVIQEIQHTEVDTLLYTNGAVIWSVLKKDYSKSGMHDFVGTRVYKHMTARNVNTVRKIASFLK